MGVGIVQAELRACRSQKASRATEASMVSRVLHRSSRDSFCRSWEKVRPLCWFSIFKRHEERWHFSWASFPQSHILMVRIEAQKEVGVGGQQMQVDQAVDNGLRLSAIILMNLGAPCWWAIRS